MKNFIKSITVNKKQILYKSILFFVTTAISTYLCIEFIYKILLPSNTGAFGRITFTILLSYSLFVFINWFISKKINRNELILFLIIYLLMFFSLLFSRNYNAGQIFYINLKIGYFNDASAYIKYGNFLILAPVGFVFYYLYKIKIIFSLVMCGLIVSFLEIIQLLFKKGTFDINDIILNTMGFVFGCFLLYLHEKAAVYRQNNMNNRSKNQKTQDAEL